MKVLITGASSGIGRSLAIYFGKLGYDLVLAARCEEKLKEVVKEVGSQVHVEYFVMDLTNLDNCFELYEKVGNIDILVNNAGFGLFGEFTDVSLEKELEMIDINIRVLHTLTKLFLKDMLKKDQGHILNVASVAGFMPGPLMTTYYATKNYVVRFSEGIREELRHQKSNVKISILCPGPVKTNFDQVAGVRFSLKGRDSDEVARYTVLKMLQGKFYIVPGISIRVLRGMSRFVPTSFLARIVYYQQKRKKDV